MATQPLHGRARTKRRRFVVPRLTDAALVVAATRPTPVHSVYRCSGCDRSLWSRATIYTHNLACADRGERSYRA